jgi:hypothetical protein
VRTQANSTKVTAGYGRHDLCCSQSQGALDLTDVDTVIPLYPSVSQALHP